MYNWMIDCTDLELGYYVCVGVPGTPTIPITKTTAIPTSTGPSPEQTGITKNCECLYTIFLFPPTRAQNGKFLMYVCNEGNKFYKVVSGDYCEEIASKNDITVQQFYSWNPAVGVSVDFNAISIRWYQRLTVAFSIKV
jgi:hypothetical protein